ncbi:MAG: thioredoxin domain-containing protein [Cyclobacteriaceae bacterium]|nr:thioredoxin domain-containing protein [Cyclobacteriaceae bacterium]
MEKVAAKFLSHLKIPVSKRYVQQLVTAHPDFPSLLSVSDVFSRLGVTHRVTRIQKDQLSELEYPYLLPLDKGRGDILLIDSHESLRKNNDRLEQWGGIVLLADSSKTTSDNDNNILYTLERNAKACTLTAGIAFILLLGLSQLSPFAWINVVLLALTICGLITGYFLFAKELGIAYSAVEAFCNTGKNTNCDAVLKSEVSLLGIKFSDAALTYFLFQVFLLGLAPALSLEIPVVFVLAILSLLTLPIILFSLYYQYVIAKTWCRLCLVVVAILLGQAGILGYAFFAGLITKQGVSLVFVAAVFIMGLLLLAIVLLVKYTLERHEKLNQQRSTGNRIKHNASVFLSFLQKQKQIDDTPFENDMIMGNPNAPIKITMVSNLYCNPCKLKHQVAAQLVATYPESIRLTMRFVKSANYKVRGLDSLDYLAGAWLTHARGKANEQEVTARMLHSWFDLWDLEKFGKKWFVSEVVRAECKRLAEVHNNWANAAEIRQTPAIFLNGYEMPKEYSIEDFLVMVPALDEKMKSMMNIEMQPA